MVDAHHSPVPCPQSFSPLLPDPHASLLSFPPLFTTLQLTAREKRQIAATLKLVVRQQSTGYYHKQQGHKEAIMRRQALLQVMLIVLLRLATSW